MKQGEIVQFTPDGKRYYFEVMKSPNNPDKIIMQRIDPTNGKMTSEPAKEMSVDAFKRLLHQPGTITRRTETPRDPSRREILSRKFDTEWEGKGKFKPDEVVPDYTAPDLAESIAPGNPAEQARIKELLLKKFDIPESKAEVTSRREILSRKFKVL